MVKNKNPPESNYSPLINLRGRRRRDAKIDFKLAASERLPYRRWIIFFFFYGTGNPRQKHTMLITGRGTCTQCILTRGCGATARGREFGAGEWKMKSKMISIVGEHATDIRRRAPSVFTRSDAYLLRRRPWAGTGEINAVNFSTVIIIRFPIYRY